MNQAILNETGYPGGLIPAVVDYKAVEVSRNDEGNVLVRLANASIAFDIDNEDVVFVQQDNKWYYAY